MNKFDFEIDFYHFIEGTYEINDIKISKLSKTNSMQYSNAYIPRSSMHLVKSYSKPFYPQDELPMDINIDQAKYGGVKEELDENFDIQPELSEDIFDKNFDVQRYQLYSNLHILVIMRISIS